MQAAKKKMTKALFGKSDLFEINSFEIDLFQMELFEIDNFRNRLFGNSHNYI